MTSAKETRAATLVEWLQRLQRRHETDMYDEKKKQLTIHLLGADYREGNTGAETLEVFRMFTEHVATQTYVTSLKLVLVGPNVSRKLHLQQYSQQYTSGDTVATGTCQVTIMYFVGDFIAYFEAKTQYWLPDLVVCFNAGIWGYDTWRSSLQLVLHEVQVPLLVTSYNQDEARDDEDLLDELMPFQWLWRPEKNLYGATTPRGTENANGAILKENNYWMCLTGRLV